MSEANIYSNYSHYSNSLKIVSIPIASTHLPFVGEHVPTSVARVCRAAVGYRGTTASLQILFPDRVG